LSLSTSAPRLSSLKAGKAWLRRTINQNNPTPKNARARKRSARSDIDGVEPGHRRLYSTSQLATGRVKAKAAFYVAGDVAGAARQRAGIYSSARKRESQPTKSDT